jgi:hypothetical protein
VTFSWGTFKNGVKIPEALFLWAFGWDHKKKVSKIMENVGM